MCWLHGTSERNIDRTAQQPLVLHGRRHLHQADLNVGKAMPKFPDDGREKLPRTTDKKSDRQGSNLSVKRLLDVGSGLSQLGPEPHAHPTETARPPA